MAHLVLHVGDALGDGGDTGNALLESRLLGEDVFNLWRTRGGTVGLWVMGVWLMARWFVGGRWMGGWLMIVWWMGGRLMDKYTTGVQEIGEWLLGMQYRICTPGGG